MIISDLVYKKKIVVLHHLRDFFLLFLEGMHFTKGKISAQVL